MIFRENSRFLYSQPPYISRYAGIDLQPLPTFPFCGLLKKAVSNVFAIVLCSRIIHTLRPQKWLPGDVELLIVTGNNEFNTYFYTLKCIALQRFEPGSPALHPVRSAIVVSVRYLILKSGLARYYCMAAGNQRGLGCGPKFCTCRFHWVEGGGLRCLTSKRG